MYESNQSVPASTLHQKAGIGLSALVCRGIAAAERVPLNQEIQHLVCYIQHKVDSYNNFAEETEWVFLVVKQISVAYVASSNQRKC